YDAPLKKHDTFNSWNKNTCRLTVNDKAGKEANRKPWDKNSNQKNLTGSAALGLFGDNGDVEKKYAVSIKQRKNEAQLDTVFSLFQLISKTKIVFLLNSNIYRIHLNFRDNKAMNLKIQNFSNYRLLNVY